MAKSIFCRDVADTVRRMRWSNAVRLLANDKMRIIATAKCNLDCFYCHNEGQAKDDSFLEIDTLQSVARVIRESDITVNEVTVSGGEPLLHPRLLEIVSVAASFSESVTMVSNGILADKARLGQLVSVGLDKIRLGVDSLHSTKPRPSKGYLAEAFQIEKLLDAAHELGLALDLNVVITKFNRFELGALARFAIEHSLSIKFFEHVDVDEFGGTGRGGVMISRPHVTYEEFVSQLRTSIGPAVVLSAADRFGDANVSCYIGDSEIRYCRYLCNYDLCWLTGTRLDARGYVYNCMVNRGVDRIGPESEHKSIIRLIETASQRPCRFAKESRT
jgi:cyclic pyranopterin phosphate synthase